MKETAIKRINTFGKVGSIVALVCKIIMIVLTALCLVVTIASVAIPKKFVNIMVTTSVKVGVDLSDFGVDLSDYKDEIESEISSGHVTADNGLEVISPVTGTVDGSRIEVNAGTYSVTATPRNLTAMMAVTTLTMACALVVLIFIEQLMRALKTCESPFAAEVIKKIRAIAFSLIPMAALSMINVNPFSGLPSDSLSINVGSNLGIIILILVILGLSYIFKYGAELQQESDETL